MHIAMWSGPRNLSTAMMYSFGARADFDVVDEPFYGAYLSLTGLDHPMGDDIIQSMPCDPTYVADTLNTTYGTDQTRHLYSKQMTHHMVDDIPRGWFASAHHVFLIRHPARVVASYSVKRDMPTLEDLGFVQQVDIFNAVRSAGRKTIVVDSFDVRRDPESTLKSLCKDLKLSWDPAMLSWPSGGHPSDGIWASHWYKAVHNSTGFAGAEGALPMLTDSQENLVNAALPFYETLKFADK